MRDRRDRACPVFSEGCVGNKSAEFAQLAL